MFDGLGSITAFGNTMPHPVYRSLLPGIQVLHLSPHLRNS